MSFFCLPIVFGCPTNIKPDGDQTPRICPRCHNISVVSAKSKTWFELCFVPLIPMTSKHIWICSVCQWSVPMQQGWEPQLPGGGPYPGRDGYHPQGQSGYHPQQPPRQNYQPAYFHNEPLPPK